MVAVDNRRVAHPRAMNRRTFLAAGSAAVASSASR